MVALSPMAHRLAHTLPACPVKAVVDLPCPTCGSTRAALALSRLDVASAISASPLATAAWAGLVGGGLIAGLLALWGRPLREPEWIQSALVRWALVVAVLANWIYLVGVGA